MSIIQTIEADVKSGETKFLAIIHKAEVDLNKAFGWAESTLKVIAPEAEALVPSLTPIVSAIESTIEELQAATSQPLSSATIQQVVQAVTTLETIKQTVASASTGAGAK